MLLTFPSLDLQGPVSNSYNIVHFPRPSVLLRDVHLSVRLVPIRYVLNASEPYPDPLPPLSPLPTKSRVHHHP